MQAIDILKKEHRQVEQYLLDMELLIKTDPVNYPALHHLIKTCIEFWDTHEEKEDRIFRILQENGYQIPIEKIEFEHGELKKDRNALIEAMNSGSEFKVKEALRTQGKDMIEKLRKHMAFEDQFIYTFSEELIGEEAAKKVDDAIK